MLVIPPIPWRIQNSTHLCSFQRLLSPHIQPRAADKHSDKQAISYFGKQLNTPHFSSVVTYGHNFFRLPPLVPRKSNLLGIQVNIGIEAEK